MGIFLASYFSSLTEKAHQASPHFSWTFCICWHMVSIAHLISRRISKYWGRRLWHYMGFNNFENSMISCDQWKFVYGVFCTTTSMPYHWQNPFVKNSTWNIRRSWQTCLHWKRRKPKPSINSSTGPGVSLLLVSACLAGDNSTPVFLFSEQQCPHFCI